MTQRMQDLERARRTSPIRICAIVGFSNMAMPMVIAAVSINSASACGWRLHQTARSSRMRVRTRNIEWVS